MFPAPIAEAPPIARIAYRAALATTLLLWLLPLLGIAYTSVRGPEDLNRGNIWGWPSDFRIEENYQELFAGSAMPQFLLNSFLITLPSVAGALALSCMAGFALAKFRLPGSLFLLAVFVSGNLVPSQILMIPVRDLMIDVLGIHDTHLALILFHVAFQTGFCTLFMHSFIRRLPDALFDAARLDGLGDFAMLWHVVLPLVRPAMAGLAVLVFTFVWNDYFWSLVLVQSDAVRPVAAGLQTLRGMWLASWHLVSAAAIVAALPPVLIFFLMQRHFVAGLTLGVTED